MDDFSTQHVPVLMEEVLAQLNPQPGQILLDGTLGGGGHSRRLAERVVPGGRVYALDRDRRAVEAAQKAHADVALTPLWANYRDVKLVLDDIGLERFDGALIDIGLSSDQLADASRGFSFTADGPLDLRFDVSEGVPASELIRKLEEQPLADLIYKYGEERFSRRIARAIVERRREKPITTAFELAELVKRCIPRTPDAQRIHPATRTFQALRIAVNDELGALENFLRDAPECVRVGGRVAVITFHSLEDRIVKDAFRDDARWTPLTKKPITAGEAELARNPRARSAKLRTAMINPTAGTPRI
ncbi:MAG: 16S rRNA (cytosine(1402)-N(4))-methyltransferase RsmH [Planctomycetales bacterium]|nr:16S rRNA (cytosine(1402)-N(4))-methyltransferase RsmH [Planctomycetales bacterium]MBN8627565.1 16S rRNA (cytosine(1402)-N(4))-methyltransferase RsmH [Planctomycetota bacterium]